MPDPLNDLIWIPLLKDFKVKAELTDGSIWSKALGFLDQTGYLKIQATGIWSYSSGLLLKCSANGDLHSPLDPKRCVHESSPIGCLIGRIGGSVAARTSDGIFTVGSYFVKKLDADTKGPLYLAINDMWSGFEDNSDEVSVDIFIAALTSATGASTVGTSLRT